MRSKLAIRQRHRVPPLEEIAAMTDHTFQSDRRRALQAGAAALAASALPMARASDEKILIGYWPIASGLPLYAALERGFFKEAGLNVEGVKFASAQQVAEAMIAGRIHGSANGTASAVLGLAEITSPGLFKIICSNPSNHKLVLDQFVVPKDSPIKSIAELKGKRVGSGPGIQNVTLAKIILEKNGIADPKVVELPIGQHVPALAADQLDAVYTLEPTGTAGRLKGLTRVLENGVISKYVLTRPGSEARPVWSPPSSRTVRTTRRSTSQPMRARWTLCARTPTRHASTSTASRPLIPRWSMRCPWRASRCTTSSVRRIWATSRSSTTSSRSARSSRVLCPSNR